VLPRPQCQQPHAHSQTEWLAEEFRLVAGLGQKQFRDGDDRGSRVIARAVSLAPTRAHPIGHGGAGASRARGYRAGDERM
jgi:hypothetical protein